MVDHGGRTGEAWRDVAAVSWCIDPTDGFACLLIWLARWRSSHNHLRSPYLQQYLEKDTIDIRSDLCLFSERPSRPTANTKYRWRAGPRFFAAPAVFGVSLNYSNQAPGIHVQRIRLSP
jgi:hypothetical protein